MIVAVTMVVSVTTAVAVVVRVRMMMIVIMPTITVAMVVCMVMTTFLNLESNGDQVEQAKDHHGDAADQGCNREEFSQQVMGDTCLIKVEKYASPEN